MSGLPGLAVTSDQKSDYRLMNKSSYNSLAVEYRSRLTAYVDRDWALLEPFICQLSRDFQHPIRVLDVGCGTGLNLLQLSQRGFLVVGIDIAERMVELAHTVCPKALLVHGDFLAAGFSKGSFEGVVSKASLHLFPKRDAYRVLTLIHDLLVPGGRIYVSTTVHEYSWEGYEKKEDYPGRPVRFRKHWTRSELLEALKQTGFSVVMESSDCEAPLEKSWINVYARREVAEVDASADCREASDMFGNDCNHDRH